MSKTTANTYTKQKSKNAKILSNLSQNKSIVEKIISFLTQKDKFRLFSCSKHLLKEYDIKIDDFFFPRKYQDQIKNYNKTYEDLFYKILNDIKKEKEKNGEKICLYQIENNMVKYLKYLTIKYDKMVQISLINVNSMEIWKLDFISKLFETLEKNIHLKLSLNYFDVKNNEIFSYICRFSKAVNILEIVEVYTNKSQLKNKNINEDIVSCFNWNTINKIIINVNENIKNKEYEFRSEKFLIYLLNLVKTPNLTEFVSKCNYLNFNEIEEFIKKNGKNIKSLNLENYKLKNDSEIDNNSMIKYLESINELSLIIDENNLEKLLCFFYPIFPKIKKFHLVINDRDEQINDDKIKENEKDKKSQKRRGRKKKKKEIDQEGNKTKTIKKDNQLKFCLNQLNYFSEIPNIDFDFNELLDKAGNDEDTFGNTKNINLKTITFTSDKKEISKEKKKKINNNKYISTLSNLNNCESLTYEIKSNNINLNVDKGINILSYLISALEVNCNNLHYLEIYINNNDLEPLKIKEFELLIKKISGCKNLNTFIFEFELFNEYASLFNKFFDIGKNLTHLSLIHSTDLDIMKIINRHVNLINIKFELISNNAKISKEIIKNYYFNLDLNRKWESIDLTNYPINQNLHNFLNENKNIASSLNSCTNAFCINENIINMMNKNDD